ncbi:MAG: GntR family transcriptional regulator [Dermatophilaceae bacterium]
MPPSQRDRAETLAAELLAAIQQGDYGPGDRLPSVGELAQRWGTNKNTASKAIQQLKNLGVLTGPPGGYTRVRTPPTQITRQQPMRYLTEKARAVLPEEERRKTGASEIDTGLTKDDFAFHAEYSTVDASVDQAALFGVAPGTRLLARAYTTLANGTEAVGVGRSFLIHDVAAQNSALLDPANEPWPGGTHNQLRTIGVEIGRVEDHVTARPPLPAEAKALGLDRGVSVLVFRKLSYAVTGELVEIADFVLPGDRTELVYSIDLPRWNQ